MFAKNWLLASFAASACSRASFKDSTLFSSSSSRVFSSDTSTKTWITLLSSSLLLLKTSDLPSAWRGISIDSAPFRFLRALTRISMNSLFSLSDRLENKPDANDSSMKSLYVIPALIFGLLKNRSFI